MASLGIEIVHRPDRRGDDCAQLMILKNQCVFTAQIAKSLKVSLMGKIQEICWIKIAVSMDRDLGCLRSGALEGLVMPGEDHVRSEDLVKSESPVAPAAWVLERVLRYAADQLIAGDCPCISLAGRCPRFPSPPFYDGSLPILPYVAKLGSCQPSRLRHPHGW